MDEIQVVPLCGSCAAPGDRLVVVVPDCRRALASRQDRRLETMAPVLRRVPTVPTGRRVAGVVYCGRCTRRFGR